MWEHHRADRSTSLFVSLIVASFVLMTLDVRAAGQGLTGTLRDGSQAVVGPVQDVVTAVLAPAARVMDGLASVAGLRAENQRLRGEIERLRAHLGRLEDLEAENAEMRAILNLPLPAQLQARTVAARVVALGPSNFDYSLTINRGLSDGVAVDMPVVDELGLVGRVVAVSERSARVSMIIDPQQKVAVRAATSRDLGVVEGRGAGPLSLILFQASEPLLAGDRIVTAGSDFFPPDLPVGTVMEAARPEAGFVLRTMVEPGVQFHRLDFVKVILWTSELREIDEGTTVTTP